MIIDAIAIVITEEDNNVLTALFQPQEFKDAMFFMHPDKCSGPDKFNLGFSFNIFGLFVVVTFFVNVVYDLTTINFHLNLIPQILH